MDIKSIDYNLCLIKSFMSGLDEDLIRGGIYLALSQLLTYGRILAKPTYPYIREIYELFHSLGITDAKGKLMDPYMLIEISIGLIEDEKDKDLMKLVKLYLICKLHKD